MYVCMYVYMYVCVCMNVCVRVCIYIWMFDSKTPQREIKPSYLNHLAHQIYVKDMLGFVIK